MMTQAFYTGLSGIRSNQFAIDVVSDNLANMSTVGFRGSEYEFSNLFGAMLNTDASSSSVDSSVGTGTRIQATPLKTTTGTIGNTDRSTDLAILDDGWFGIQGSGAPIYTRDGAFTFDSQNSLVSLDGFHVLGTPGNNISPDGVLTTRIDEVKLGDVATQKKLSFPKSLSYPPESTTKAKYFGSLGGVDEIRTMGASVIDPQSNVNNLKLTFSRVVPQTNPGTQWDVVATTESNDGVTIYDTKSGRVTFDANGSLESSSLTTIDNNGAQVNIDLGSGLDGVYDNSNMAFYASSQADGTIGGDLQGYSINMNAEVIATFTNGMQSSVGKIAVYHFQNDQGLDRLNGSKFQESANSGSPIFFQNAAGENILGTGISNFTLEGSNIDMTYGLTELIILQRSYDANSKLITTSDQMLQKALGMDA
jgi:flagellar hook protein FlgE